MIMVAKFKWIVQVQARGGRWIDHFSCETRRRAREEMKIVTRKRANGERILWRILQVDLCVEPDTRCAYCRPVDSPQNFCSCV
jgi:hypothetical protein